MVSTMTVRNLPDEVHRALRVRAAQNGRSTEAEVRDILTQAAMPEKRLRLGDALSELSRSYGLANEDFEIFEHIRDKTPAEPMKIE
jgi:plasmid stability protein